jgi:photosystem II stability/assembly factor-like uncharacterized protein
MAIPLDGGTNPSAPTSLASLSGFFQWLSYNNIMRKTLFSLMIFFLVIILSGCGSGSSSTSSSSSSPAVSTNQSLLKSVDGGKNFEPIGKIDEKKNIGAVNVLSMEINRSDGKMIYVGTEKDGLFASNNSGETWKKITFPLTKIYGLSLGNAEGNIIYAGGLLDKRGKIFRSDNGGEKWEEIYSEATDGPTISSLRTLKNNSQVVYAGTSVGAIFKTENGGATWRNIYKAGGPVIDISQDAQNSDVVYFGVFENGILRTKDGGKTVEDALKNNQMGFNFSRQVYAVEADPVMSGVVYVGIDKGIVRGMEYGEKIEAVNVLESAKNQPVRAMAISPFNSNEITFSSAQAVYKSTDGGKQWAVYQLESTKHVEEIEYDSTNSDNIFLGLRK